MNWFTRLFMSAEDRLYNEIRDKALEAKMSQERAEYLARFGVDLATSRRSSLALFNNPDVLRDLQQLGFA